MESKGWAKVIPADREMWIQYEDFDGAFADKIRTGSEDHTCGLQLFARHRLAFSAPPDGERNPSPYQFGNRLFVDLRAFLSLAGIDPNGCAITITVPTADDRDSIVSRLREDAPPVGDLSRVSSAQAGNNAGQWQGMTYEIAASTHQGDREAIARGALELAQPILEAEYEQAKASGDSDWEGQSFMAFEAVKRALSASLTPSPNGEGS